MDENRQSAKIMVEGFWFTNAKEAEQAKKEAEGIRYIREKTDMDQPEAVLRIYNKMVQQRLFETPVGFLYLKELQEYLRTIPFIRNEDILPIPVLHPALESDYRQRERELLKRRPQQETKTVNTDYKKRYQVMMFFCAVLMVCVAAMFAITATSNNATILNYETKIIDKYEAWEQELTERENALREREAAAGMQVTE